MGAVENIEKLEEKIDRLIDVLDQYNHNKKKIKSYDIELYWANTCYELATAIKYLLSENEDAK